MHLQERDKQILKLCYEHEFLILDHVREFFKGNDREARRRVQELREQKYLCKDFHPLLGKQVLIRLDHLGANWMRHQHPLAPPKKPSATTLIHNTLVTSVRLRLSKLWNAEFVPERAIKARDFPEIPDGLFFFPSGNAIAIEVENSDKGRTRFLKLLDRWKDSSKVIFVLYVASNPQLHRILKSYLKDGPQEQPIGVVLWDDLKAGTPAVFTNQGDVELLSQREF